MTQITVSTTPAVQKYSWQKPEIVYFKASDGLRVPARLYQAGNAPKGGPAVIFVYGAGYLQNVHHWWNSYYRDICFTIFW